MVNNEARELNSHRIRTFKLDEFVDFFISSCFVHFRKPDADIFRLALDIAQVPAEQVVYIDDRPMFVQVAGRSGNSRHPSHGLQVHVRETGFVRIADMTKESSMKPANPRILTINGGSSSIKFALFEAGDSLRRILEGGIERIGLPEATLRVKGLNQADNFSRPVAAPDHTAAVGALMDWIEERIGRDALTAVGHRVVHGGPKYSDPQLITKEMVEELHRLSPSIPSICRRRSC